MKFRPTSTARSPASASTRAPRTPAPTSATSGRTTGTLLATATFTGETASGWQQVDASPRRSRSPPARPTSRRTTRRTATTPSTPTTSPAPASTTAPLHALADGVDGGNGVYRYGAERLPDQHLPVEQLLGRRRLRDQRRPTPRRRPSTATSPAAGATDVAAGANVTATFSEAMDAATINGTHVELRDPSKQLVAATVTYDAATRTATLDPDRHARRLDHATPRPSRAAPTASRTSPATRSPPTRTWSFTTAAPPPPPPDEGPGGPILVVANAANPFSRYYAEILRAEGLNAFTAIDISTVTPATLARLRRRRSSARCRSPRRRSTMLSDWVNGGRQPDRDAARQAARRPARPDRRRRHARERLPPGRHRAPRRAPASSARRSSSTAPPTATRSTARPRSRRSTRTRRPRRRTRP